MVETSIRCCEETQNKMRESLKQALDVVKKHKIKETVRFSTYSSPKDFGVMGKKLFDFVM